MFRGPNLVPTSVGVLRDGEEDAERRKQIREGSIPTRTGTTSHPSLGSGTRLRRQRNRTRKTQTVGIQRIQTVAYNLTNKQNDGDTLEPMLDQVKANCGQQPKDLSADAGYASEANLRVLKRRRVRGVIATGRQRHGTASATKAHGAPHGPLMREMRARIRRRGRVSPTGS